MDRWHNYLSPSLRSTEWSEREVTRLFKEQAAAGFKWAAISKKFPGRSKNELKNKFYSTIRRNMRKFNRHKFAEEKIIGKIKVLMSIPEIRKILESPKILLASVLMKKKISKAGIDMMNERARQDMSDCCFGFQSEEESVSCFEVPDYSEDFFNEIFR